MPSLSKAQQGLMGAAYAYKTGRAKGASAKVKSVAKGMSRSSLRDFASTPTKGLPQRVANKKKRGY